MPSGGYRGELKGSGRRGPQPSVARAKPPQEQTPRESWWLDGENFYALARSRDWGKLGHANLNTFAIGENDTRSHGPAKQWQPPAERPRKELGAM